MSKEQELLKVNLPKFLRRQSIDIALFAYVSGIKDIRPEFNNRAAIELFIKKFNINEDDYNQESAESRFYCMQKEFIKSKKS